MTGGLLRLLGVDDQFARRANCGFLDPDEDNWRRWIADDAAARIGPRSSQPQ